MRSGDDAVVYGLGQMGAVFAHGLLRSGARVVPVTRSLDPGDVAVTTPRPAMVVVAVGEAELGPVLRTMPAPWRDRLVLLQNELLPRTWEAHAIDAPTVAVAWFEKKRDTGVRVLVTTPVAGPVAGDVVRALDEAGVDAEVVDDTRLPFELVAKNLYILTTNLAGLEVGGTVGALWEAHRPLAERVAADVLSLQEAMLGERLDRLALLEKMARVIAADPEHRCMGRSAPARLSRALEQAREHGVNVPALRALEARR